MLVIDWNLVIIRINRDDIETSKIFDRKVTKIEIIQNQQIDSSDTDRTFTHVLDVHTHELDDTWVGSIR